MLSTLEIIFILLQLFFAGAFGACVGSLVNVLVYRMPLGIGVVTPPSRCPNCTTLLTWRENIPVLGWILLKGRCRFCGVRISPEYPIVEASVAALFMLIYAVCYLIPPYRAMLWGIDWSWYRPEWTEPGFAGSWGPFVVVMVLVGSLAAMTIVDAKTFTIPLALTWFPAAVAVILHPLFVWYLHATNRRMSHVPDWDWSMPIPGRHGWDLIGIALGGVVGLGVGNVLLSMGLIRRSFADYEAWEKAHFPLPPEIPLDPATGPVVMDARPIPAEAAEPAMAAPERAADVWTIYPHARREMFKELVFLAPACALAMAGGSLAHWAAGPWTKGMVPTPTYEPAMWLRVLAGVLFGYLVGGGVVWLVRILGSVLFGKEAMGLGDVHLMAAVGACLGWIDSTLAFFGAAFVGLAWWLLGLIFRGAASKTMPYGPFLAVATILVFLLKPLIEAGLTRLLHADPAVNLP